MKLIWTWTNPPEQGKKESLVSPNKIINSKKKILTNLIFVVKEQ